mmetsp:Transcript_25313/g.79855  ORF Transcript_25313/g.79855 Transcript_25313/m.79855 type:complete len:286 (+) Transcript_25313:813-1670(+)
MGVVRIADRSSVQLLGPHEAVGADGHEGAEELHGQVLQAPVRVQGVAEVRDLHADGHGGVHDRAGDLHGGVAAGDVAEAHGEAHEAVGVAHGVVPPGGRAVQVDEADHGGVEALHDDDLPRAEARLRPQVDLYVGEAVEEQRRADAARNLRRTELHGHPQGVPPGQPERDADARVELAARDVAEAVHGDHHHDAVGRHGPDAVAGRGVAEVGQREQEGTAQLGHVGRQGLPPGLLDEALMQVAHGLPLQPILVGSLEVRVAACGSHGRSGAASCGTSAQRRYAPR